MKSREEADFVCGFFNSTTGDYLIRSYALATGISTHVLERLPIPRFDRRNRQHADVSEAAHEWSALVRRGEDHAKAEERLNEAVAELLNLKAEPRRAIRRALAEFVQS